MKKKRFTDEAFLFSLQSFKNERRRLVDDSLGQSPDLYEALYENKNAPLRDVKYERYLLLALRRHWENAMSQIDKLPEAEHYADMKLFLKSYRRYIADIKGTILDINYLDANLKGLESLMATNRNWEENLKKLRIDFMKSENEFDNLIKSLSQGVG